VRAPVFLHHTAELRGVTVIDRNDAWAAGSRSPANRFHQIYVHWDGDRWRKVPPPDHDLGRVFDIDAVATDDVWAVGEELRTRHGVTRIVVRVWHFDGDVWSAVEVPRTYGFLWSIDARAARVTAVGTEEHGIPLVLEFDGTRWRRAELPDLPVLTSLSGVDGRWVVGATRGVESPGAPLVLERRSGIWERAVLPALEWASLESVVTVADDDVWAFGRLDITQGEPEANFVWSMLHFDGSTWAIAPTPSAPGSDYGYPEGATAVGDTGQVWAVGQLYGLGELRDFIRSAHGC
jgi:hypothetical protein